MVTASLLSGTSPCTLLAPQGNCRLHVCLELCDKWYGLLCLLSAEGSTCYRLWSRRDKYLGAIMLRHWTGSSKTLGAICHMCHCAYCIYVPYVVVVFEARFVVLACKPQRYSFLICLVRSGPARDRRRLQRLRWPSFGSWVYLKISGPKIESASAVLT